MGYIRKKARGQIIVLFTLFVGFLMGFSALAFDVGYAMIVRAELITALDAAALAAIRYVPDGQSAMTNAANRTFVANLPLGKLAIKNPTLTPPVSTTVNGGIDVSLSATADAPTFFARWFGRDKITINAAATTSRRDRNVIHNLPSATKNWKRQWHGGNAISSTSATFQAVTMWRRE
jgi:Flp pilus assembly protein TadG